MDDFEGSDVSTWEERDFLFGSLFFSGIMTFLKCLRRGFELSSFKFL